MKNYKQKWSKLINFNEENEESKLNKEEEYMNEIKKIERKMDENV